MFAGTKRALPLSHGGHAGVSDAFVPAAGRCSSLLAGPAGLIGAARGISSKFDADWLPATYRWPGATTTSARLTSTLAMLAGAALPRRKPPARCRNLGNRALRADALNALVLVREGALAGLGPGPKRPACCSCSPAWANKPANCPDAATRRRPGWATDAARAIPPGHASWSRCSSSPWAGRMFLLHSRRGRVPRRSRCKPILLFQVLLYLSDCWRGWPRSTSKSGWCSLVDYLKDDTGLMALVFQHRL